jgi:hypothetical protein
VVVDTAANWTSTATICSLFASTNPPAEPLAPSREPDAMTETCPVASNAPPCA